MISRLLNAKKNGSAECMEDKSFVTSTLFKYHLTTACDHSPASWIGPSIDGIWGKTVNKLFTLGFCS